LGGCWLWALAARICWFTLAMLPASVLIVPASAASCELTWPSS
jgi:hypothetical protein